MNKKLSFLISTLQFSMWMAICFSLIYQILGKVDVQLFRYAGF